MGRFSHKAAGLIAAVFLLLLSLGSLSCGAAEPGTTTSEATAPRTTKTFPAKPRTYTYTQPPAFQSSQFTSSTVCATCHQDIYDQWKGSMMSNSINDRFFQAEWDKQSQETGGKYDFFCISCHTPIGGDSREVPPPVGPNINQVLSEGVQCDFCHTLTSPDTYKPGPLKTGPFTDSVSPAHQTAYFEFSTRSEFCGMCHDMTHPDTGVQLQTTYTEWKNSPYAAQGIQCQDCHLTPGPGVNKPNPGKAASGGPDRPHIYTHDFAGGNASALAGEEHRELAIRNLQAAAAVEVTKAGAPDPGKEISIYVGITNRGAGHSLPTGVTELREMWLEVTVTDAEGDVIFHSGGVDENGVIDPQAAKYYTQFKDKDGNPTSKPWEAAGVIFDRRVPAMGGVSETYKVQVPDSAALPLKAKAVLCYRSASQALIDELLPGELEMPVVVMAQDELEIPQEPARGELPPPARN